MRFRGSLVHKSKYFCRTWKCDCWYVVDDLGWTYPIEGPEKFPDLPRVT